LDVAWRLVEFELYKDCNVFELESFSSSPLPGAFAENLALICAWKFADPSTLIDAEVIDL